MALTYGQLAASTLRNQKKDFTDNIVADHVYLTVLGNPDVAANVFRARKPRNARFAEGLQMEESPGRSVSWSLRYSQNSTIGWYSGHETLDITPQDSFTQADFPWYSIAGSVNLDNELMDKNRGNKHRLFDIMQGHIDGLRADQSETINTALLGRQADNGTGSNAPFGLLDIVKDDPTTDPANAVGGIAYADFNGWANQLKDFSSASFETSQSGAGAQALRELLYDCCFGADKPQLLLGGNNAYESYLQTMVDQQRYMNPAAKALGNAGFDVIVAQGLPFVREPVVQTVRATASLTGDAIYALNLRHLKVVGMSNRWFEPSSVKEPHNQDTEVMHVITRLTHCSRARRTSGVLFAIASP